MTGSRRIRSRDYETGSIPARALAPGLLQQRHFAPWSVPAGALAPGTVGAPELGPGAVQAPNLAPDAVEAPAIADGAVTTPALADGSVTGPKVRAGALGARELANGSLTLPKFAQGTRPVQVVDTLPDTPLADGFLPGDPVVLLSDQDAKIYRLVSGYDLWNEADDTWSASDDLWPVAEWSSAVDTFDLRGLLEEGNFGDDVITARMVAANAIGATQLAAIYVEVDKWIRSWNWEPGVSGWAIDGDGNAEFNDATFRGNIRASSVTSGQLKSPNYTSSSGTAGWALDANGNAHLNDATFRGNIRASSVTSGQLVSANYVANSRGWAIGSNGAAEFSDVTIRGNSRVNGIVTHQIRSNNYIAGSRGWAIDNAGNSEFNDATFRGNIEAANMNGGTVTGAVLTGAGNRPIRIARDTFGRSVIAFGWRSASGDVVFAADALMYSPGDFRLRAACDVFEVEGQLTIQGHQTTTAGANTNISTAGVIRRVTSLAAAKRDVTDAGAADLAGVLALRPITFRSKLAADDPDRVHWGLIAEEVAQADPRLATYGDDGTLVGVAYDRLGVPLLAVAREHDGRLADIEQRLAALEGV